MWKADQLCLIRILKVSSLWARKALRASRQKGGGIAGFAFSICIKKQVIELKLVNDFLKNLINSVCEKSLYSDKEVWLGRQEFNAQINSAWFTPDRKYLWSWQALQSGISEQTPEESASCTSKMTRSKLFPVPKFGIEKTYWGGGVGG